METSLFHRWQRDGLGMIQAHCIYYAATDLTGGGAQVTMQVMGRGCKHR